MKSNNIIHAVVTLLILSGLTISCKKDLEIYLPEERDLSNKANIKVYNSVINSTRNYVYVDNLPVTGAGITFAGPLFPAISAFATVEAGNRNILIKDTLVTSTQKPINFSNTFDAGAYYTIFTYDTTNNTQYVVVKDNIEIPSDTTSRLRFANLVFTKTPVPNIDIYSVKLKGNMFTNVPIGQVTEFKPYVSATTDTLYARSTGTTGNLFTLILSGTTQKRSYTIAFRGRYQTTSGAIARTLTTFISY